MSGPNGFFAITSFLSRRLLHLIIASYEFAAILPGLGVGLRQ